MTDSDDESVVSYSGLSTPPLSPTKTISTYGWTSPRTPISPRKTRSCLFFRDADAQDLLPSPSASPIKPTFASRLSALQKLECQPFDFQRRLDFSPISSPIKQDSPTLDFSALSHAKHVIRFHNRSAPDSPVAENSIGTYDGTSSPPFSPVAEDARDESDHLSEGREPAALKQPESDTPADNSPMRPTAPQMSHFGPAGEAEGNLLQLPLRLSSSPLRPSQWATRGGMLTPPASLGRFRDRFIAVRRPPFIARESFELNKPSHRLSGGDRTDQGAGPNTDPFSRRLHRSGRLNDELQSLRETHSVITGRANSSRRGANLSLRRTSHTLGVRHVSPGTVWTVGGASAVSDTVVGVSNGRGGVMGSGTNAPLYTSMFLSRSDPEAELEAYERRLALAFDVDQADRVLNHTPAELNSTKSSPNAGPSTRNQTRHVWRDNSWAKDNPTTSLFAASP